MKPLNNENPHAGLLRAIADGHPVEVSFNNSDDCHYSWRIKPVPKPDIINMMFVEAFPKLDNAWNKPNLELTFDGETQKLKSVRILDATN